jgi:hypothetical protein
MGAEQASLLVSPPYNPRTPSQEIQQTLNIAIDISLRARVDRTNFKWWNCYCWTLPLSTRVRLSVW